MSKNFFTRGELAKKAGVGFEAVRFYENKKMIPPPDRTDSGYRQYPPETLERILFLKRAQELGFTLNEIKELLGLVENSRLKCGTVNQIAKKKVEEVEKKISDLIQLKKALLDIVSRCNINASLKDCPLIETLNGNKK